LDILYTRVEFKPLNDMTRWLTQRDVDAYIDGLREDAEFPGIGSIVDYKANTNDHVISKVTITVAAPTWKIDAEDQAILFSLPAAEVTDVVDLHTDPRSYAHEFDATLIEDQLTYLE
jgi:hypothetical protein